MPDHWLTVAASGGEVAPLLAFGKSEEDENSRALTAHREVATSKAGEALQVLESLIYTNTVIINDLISF